MTHLKDALVIDIETVTPPWSSLDNHTQSYLVNREIKSNPSGTREQALAKAQENLFLVPGMSRIICIGMWRTDKSAGVLLREGAADQMYKDKDNNYTALCGDETFILNSFWDRVLSAREDGLRFVTFYGEHYDVPVIQIRSALLGVKPTVNIFSSKFPKNSTFHLDLDAVLSSRGATKHFSLDYWCRQFSISSPKDHGMIGAGVQKAYLQGNLKEIGEYCMRDVQATAQLYTKLNSTLLSVFFD